MCITVLIFVWYTVVCDNNKNWHSSLIILSDESSIDKHYVHYYTKLPKHISTLKVLLVGMYTIIHVIKGFKMWMNIK